MSDIEDNLSELAISENRAKDKPTTVADDVNCVWASTLYTQYCADSTEWCPHVDKERYCLVGNYELLGEDKGKVGEVYLTSVENAIEKDRDVDKVKIALECVLDYASSSITSEEAASLPLPTSSSVSNQPHINVIDRVATPAVLDIKWNPVLNEFCNDNIPTNQQFSGSSFAVAYEDGSMRLYTLSEDDTSKKTSITEQCNLQISMNSALCLSLDWNTRRIGLPTLHCIPNDENTNASDNDQDDDNDDDYIDETLPRDTQSKLVTSLSDGSVAIANVDFSCEDTTQALSIRHHWQAHSMEAWIASFDNWSPNIVYSGSDDTLFKQWDLRLVPIIHPDDHHDCFTPSKHVPAVTISKEHQGGVCSIVPHPYNPHILATGSYDEKLRIWDKRNMKSPITSMDMNGGVWRIKWHPDPLRSSSMLITNMYNGLHIVDYDTQYFPKESKYGTFTSIDDIMKEYQDENPSTTIFKENTTQIPFLQREAILDKYLDIIAPSDNINYNDSKLEIKSSYNRHGPKTIAYGGDWTYLQDIKQLYPTKENDFTIPGVLIQSASFYNKRVDLWYPSQY